MSLCSLALQLLIVYFNCLHLSHGGLSTFLLPKNKFAKQSSTYSSSENSMLGNDGNTTGNYIAGVQCVQCASGDPLPWWMVDMEKSYFIYGASVWNRIDGPCAARFTQVRIGVASNPSVWTSFDTSQFDVCMYWTGQPTATVNPINFTCSSAISGRYLAVYKNVTGLSVDAATFYHFCEIDIYVGVQKIVPKNKPSKQSSTYSSSENPMLGNDGNTAGNYIAGVQCFHSANGDTLPWWMVDMEQNYFIYGASVWNRIDGSTAVRFTQVSIGVTYNPSVWTNFDTNQFDLCMYWTGHPTAADNPINITCSNAIAGRYLAVYKNVTGLSGLESYHFCEIDIYAVARGIQDSYMFNQVSASFSPTSTSALHDAPLFLRSEIQCVMLCSNNPTCLFVMWKAVSAACWLFSAFPIPANFSSAFNSGDVMFFALRGFSL